MKKITFFFLLLIALGAVQAQTTGNAESIWVIEDGTKTDWHVQSLDGVFHLSAGDVASLVGTSLSWNANTKTLRFTRGDRSIRLIAENPFVWVNGQYRSTPLPLRMVRGELLVPVATVADVFQPLIGTVIHWDHDTKTLTISTRPDPGNHRLAVDTVILDPGHGGKDPGAVGPSGYYEKKATLIIARHLEALLKKAGFRVVMTRTKDIFVSLSDRARIANQAQGDLYVSIHCNATKRRKSAAGFETYFLSVAKTDWARAVEARENASIQFEDPSSPYADEVGTILWDLAQNEYLKESSTLARSIQEAMDRKLGIENRGIGQAGFYVLKGVYMPSVLVECAFISNKAEERLLKQNTFCQQIAGGICQGIMEFSTTYQEKLIR